MASARLVIVNALSGSRVGAAVLFIVLALQDNFGLRILSLAVLVLGLLTDMIDGKLARRWRVATKLGYIVDGLGDRALYVAVLLVLMNDGLLLATTVFLVIFRDLCLYGIRSFWTDWDSEVPATRPESRSNAGILRIALGTKLATMYSTELHLGLAQAPEWRLCSSFAMALAVVAAYFFLWRYGSRSLNALFSKD